MEVERKLESMGLSLPALREPAGNYVKAVRAGNLLFVSGNIGRTEKEVIRGKLGESITLEQAYEGAKCAALNSLAVLKAELGDLDKVKRIIKLLCFVNSTSECFELPKVSNGASDLLVNLFGEKGRHARSTIGVVVPGGGSCIEIEMVVEVE